MIGGNYTFIGTYEVGDAMRIERTGSNFYIKQNGAIIYSCVMPLSKVYKLKIINNAGGYPICDVGASFMDSTNTNFPNYVQNKVVIKHCSGALSNDGSIQLTAPIGGHAYTWSPDGEQTAAILNKSPGIYSVVIKDSLGNTSNYKYDVSYKTNWENLEGTVVRNDSILTQYPYTTTGWNTVRSTNVLRPHQNGEINWLASDINNYYIVGFIDTASASQGVYTDIDEGIYQSSLLYYFSKGYYYSLGGVDFNDALKIKRENDTVKFYRNGVLLLTTTPTNANVDWKVKADVLSGNYLANVGASFNKPLNIDYYVEHAEYDNLKSGQIYVNANGGTSPYKINEVKANPYANFDLNPGTYTVTVRDSLNDTIRKVIDIGVKATWNLKNNIVQRGDTLQLTDTTQKGVLVGNIASFDNESAWYEFKLNKLNSNICFGFIGVPRNELDNSYLPPQVPVNDLNQKITNVSGIYDLAINNNLNYVSNLLNLGADANNMFFLYVNGTTLRSLIANSTNTTQTIKLGDVLRIGRTLNGSIYYSINGDTIAKFNTSVSSNFLYSTLLQKSQSSVLGQMANYTSASLQSYAARAMAIPMCSSDACGNWSVSKTYDEFGNVITQSKQYYDVFGRPTQAQQKLFSNNTILASESMYDAHGRPAGSTLVAPLNQSNMCYQPSFFTKFGNTHYDVTSYDKPNTSNSANTGEINNPLTVGKQSQGQLGWYYSNNNTLENLVAADDYPYSRVLYSNDPLCRVVKSGGVGTNHRMGSGHESEMIYGNSNIKIGTNNFPELAQVFNKLANELNADFTLKTYATNTYNKNLEIVSKGTNVNADGKLSFTFTDNLGKVIATSVEGDDNDPSCISNNSSAGLNTLLNNYVNTTQSLSNGSFINVIIPRELNAFVRIKSDVATTNLIPVFKWNDGSNTYLNSGDYTYYPNTGKVIFHANADLNLLVSYQTIPYFTMTTGNYVNITTSIKYTNWTLYYYDVKGRLKAVQSPNDVTCNQLVFSKNVLSTSPIAFNCASNQILSRNSLRVNAYGEVLDSLAASVNTLVTLENAELNINPSFNYSSLLSNSNTGQYVFETTNQNSIDSITNNARTSQPEFIPIKSDSSYVGLDSITGGVQTVALDSNALFGKQINYSGTYLVGVKRANGTITYLTNRPISFNYSLKLNGSQSTIVNNSIGNSQKTAIPAGLLDGAVEVLVKNTELTMSLSGFTGVNPQVSFNPCNANLYVEPETATLLQSINSNITLQTSVILGIPGGGSSGINTTPFARKYWYNEYNQMTASETPDEGKTYYLYDLNEGKLRFTQNEKQRVTGKFSYISYDKLGRVIENGEYDPALSDPSVYIGGFLYTPSLYVFQDYDTWKSGATVPSGAISCASLAQNDLNIFDASQRKTEQNYLAYDIPSTTLGNPYPTGTHLYTYGKVVKAWNANSASWYKYNERGELVHNTQNNVEVGFKYFEFTYDWRGKALKNYYQKSSPDEFTHQYQYDADERPTIINAQYSLGQIPITSLSYYKHGTLKRQVLGNNLQGLDYVYTITGALKSVNNPFAYAGAYGSNDPGYDGVTGSANASVKPDAFAFTLEYFPNDYVRTQSEVYAMSPTSNFNNQNISYTGQIQSMRWHTTLPASAPDAFSNSPLMFEYNYDNLYRLKQTKFGTANLAVPTCYGCTLGIAVNQPNNNYGIDNITYDKNGNIQTLKRNANATSGGAVQVMDDLTYIYNPLKPNRLNSVIDANTTNLSLSSDIDLPNQTSATNYQYNAIGEVEVNAQDNQTYTYFSTGLVKEVRKNTSNQLIASYTYNHLNLRQSKISYNSAGIAQQKLIYVYNPSGQLVATYKLDLTTSGSNPTTQDFIMYGMGKAGVFDWQTQKPYFELNDHVGNVRAVVTENSGALEVVSYTDYYPHGGTLPGRQFVSGLGYRYGYQGQEKDAETGLTNFELRQYDPRLGRWNNPDPYGQHHSPYIAMSNNPVSSIDMDGGWDYDNPDGQSYYDRVNQKNDPWNFEGRIGSTESEQDWGHMSGSMGGGINADGNFYSYQEQIMDAHKLWLDNHHIYDYTIITKDNRVIENTSMKVYKDLYNVTFGFPDWPPNSPPSRRAIYFVFQKFTPTMYKNYTKFLSERPDWINLTYVGKDAIGAAWRARNRFDMNLAMPYVKNVSESRDEFPMASTMEGGGVSVKVRLVPKIENYIQGGQLGFVYRGLMRGDKIQVVPVPEGLEKSPVFRPSPVPILLPASGIMRSIMESFKKVHVPVFRTPVIPIFLDGFMDSYMPQNYNTPIKG